MTLKGNKLSFELFFTDKRRLCIIFPSLGISERKIMDTFKNIRSEYSICVVYYSGFGKSGGSFPGKRIIETANTLIKHIESKANKIAAKIIGDSYGGLVVLGLLHKYPEIYYSKQIVLTSPLISFEKLDKNQSSPQSKEGFIRFLSNHELIKKINRKDLTNLVNHKEIPDPFKVSVTSENTVLYHYYNDENLKHSISEEFSKANNLKLVSLNGNRHSLFNFENSVLNEIFK